MAAELSFSGELLNFLRLLIDNERVGYIERILSEFSVLRDNLLNIARVKIVSAKELGPGEESRLKSIMEKALNKTAAVSPSVDKDIIGGYIIEVENTLYDGSIRTRMNNLYNYLKKEALAYAG